MYRHWATTASGGGSKGLWAQLRPQQNVDTSIRTEEYN